MKYTKVGVFLLAGALSLQAAACSSAPQDTPSQEDTSASQVTQPVETDTSAEGAGSYTAESGASAAAPSRDPAETGAAGWTTEEAEAAFSDFLTREWGPEANTGIFSYDFEPTGEAAAHPETAPLSDQLITTHLQDMDLDGKEELTAVVLEGSQGSGQGANRISVFVYEYTGQEVVMQDSASLEGCYSWNRMEDYIIGIRSTDTDVLLYLAGDQDGYLFADGVTQQLKVCRYNGETLDFLMDEAISGSDDSWQAGWAEELRSLGFALDSSWDTERWKISADELEPHFWVMCHGEATVNLEDMDAYENACQESQQAQADYLLHHAEMQGYLRGGDGAVIFGTGWPDGGPTSTDSAYILPDSDSRYLTEADLDGLTGEQLRLARNEIYARHGRIFDSPDLKEYFERQPWYLGTTPSSQFSESVLNGWERANLELILQVEEGR